ncbi:hypothetical protein [Ketogulonicigenium vulgare]|uniref:hypothetical protein n=1 Tax=Ketogulonicigenium vulgare TaxID=92945 RepID=UPI00235858B7|nr:hypothetical protein [Ketogulonicigenium vulgare]
MNTDPFAGRAASEGPPYDNALIVTPEMGDLLPVIPSALTLTYLHTDRSKAAEQGLASIVPVTVQMQNGTELEIFLSCYGQNFHPAFYPIRPTRILWDRSEALAVTLLW